MSIEAVDENLFPCYAVFVKRNPGEYKVVRMIDRQAAVLALVPGQAEAEMYMYMARNNPSSARVAMGIRNARNQLYFGVLLTAGGIVGLATRDRVITVLADVALVIGGPLICYSGKQLYDLIRQF